MQYDLFKTEVEEKLQPTIQSLIELGALFVINHSGGKDSQAMTIKIKKLVPPEQIIVVHAKLTGVEWQGTEEHAQLSAGSNPFYSVKARKTFLEMVRHRQAFPSPKYRQCTSDLKRGPIEKLIRNVLKERGELLVVSCMGLRAEESSNRAKAITFKLSERNSKAGRTWYEWLPIHDMLEAEVFETIRLAGEEPHWAYAKGMSRLSCMFCIMANKSDLRISAEINRDHFLEIVALEKEIGQSMMMPVKGQVKYLDEYIGVEAA